MQTVVYFAFDTELPDRNILNLTSWLNILMRICASTAAGSTAGERCKNV
jgi:hypothetical protein